MATPEVTVSFVHQPVMYTLAELQAASEQAVDFYAKRVEATNIMLLGRMVKYYSLTPEQQAEWRADQERMRAFYGM